jgi:YD repeat-containing protein
MQPPAPPDLTPLKRRWETGRTNRDRLLSQAQASVRELRYSRAFADLERREPYWHEREALRPPRSTRALRPGVGEYSEFGFDEHGDVVFVRTHYGGEDRFVCVIPDGNHRWAFRYDGRGELQEIRDYEYACGRLVATITYQPRPDEAWRLETYEHDARGLVVSIIRAQDSEVARSERPPENVDEIDWRHESLEHDENGRLVRVAARHPISGCTVLYERS